MSHPYTTQAVVLRSFRFSEADRVLHLYTLEQGRIGALAKGVRKTRSRFGARLEPMSHVELTLHKGSGDLHTITGVSLVHSHRRSREEPYRLRVGLIGLEAMLRLYTEQEANPRAFTALERFLSALDAVPPADAPPARDPLVLAFQLKLLWLSGYLPHLVSCVECGATDELTGYAPSSGGAVCAACDAGAIPLSSEGVRGIIEFLHRPLAEAGAVRVGERGARDALAIITASYEYHGGFRLRTVSV